MRETIWLTLKVVVISSVAIFLSMMIF
ncbi:hypothetical protein, partial [Alkalihalophilus marmarensis]